MNEKTPTSSRLFLIINKHQIMDLFIKNLNLGSCLVSNCLKWIDWFCCRCQTCNSFNAHRLCNECHVIINKVSNLTIYLLLRIIHNNKNLILFFIVNILYFCAIFTAKIKIDWHLGADFFVKSGRVIFLKLIKF